MKADTWGNWALTDKLGLSVIVFLVTAAVTARICLAIDALRSHKQRSVRPKYSYDLPRPARPVQTRPAKLYKPAATRYLEKMRELHESAHNCECGWYVYSGHAGCKRWQQMRHRRRSLTAAQRRILDALLVGEWHGTWEDALAAARMLSE